MNAAEKLILGCDGIGSAVDRENSFKLMDRFVALGGKTLDTAKIYGYPDSLSEKTIGQWLKLRNARNKVKIVSKGAHPNINTMNVSRLSYAELKEDLESSLENLGTDRIDLYFLHRDDENYPCGEIIESLNSFIKEGKILAIGASNWKAERIEKANAYAKAHGLVGFCASQIKWSYARVSETFKEDPTLVLMDKNEYERYLKSDLDIYAYASQAKGFFSKYAQGGREKLSEKAANRYYCTENIRRFELAKEIAENNGADIAEVTLAYLLAQPMRTFPIIGCKNVTQLEQSMKADASKISKTDLEKLVKLGNNF